MLSLLAAGVLLIASRPALAGDAPAPSPAPSFSVRSLDGRTLKLTDYRGKPVVLDFWATWCKPCRASMPHLSDMQERYAERGLVVVGLSVDDAAPEDVKRFADGLHVKFRVAMANDRMLDDYGPIRALPTTFFINRKGDVVRRVVGYIDAETMESYIRELF
jgi:thiol-disulfide isomerase/thioredoxin